MALKINAKKWHQKCRKGQALSLSVLRTYHVSSLSYGLVNWFGVITIHSFACVFMCDCAIQQKTEPGSPSLLWACFEIFT